MNIEGNTDSKRRIEVSGWNIRSIAGQVVDESSLIISREEIEGLRRSLAIGNSLPPDQIRRLLTSCDALLEATRGLDTRDARLRVELDALRPPISDVRTRLCALHHELHPPTPTGGPGKQRTQPGH